SGDCKIPGVGTVFLTKNVALDRNAVADLPVELLRKAFADDDTPAVADEGGALCRRQHILRIEIEIGLRVYRECDEKVLRLLIVAAEPIRMTHELDALHRARALHV